MKDVGLDLEGFDDSGSSQLMSSIESSQDMISAIYEPLGQTGCQLVAQIQQPLPLQVHYIYYFLLTTVDA